MTTAETSTDKFAGLRDVATRLRINSIRATTAAGSGHPSSCASAADLVAALFFGAMRFDPKNPKNPNSDRFVLSKGHAAPLLYAVWAEVGFLSEEDLMTLRQFDSNFEGHPTPRLPFVDVATGSLGQGLSAGVGMAFAAKIDKRDYHTWVLLGDGESAEGSVWEAAETASYYKLNHLTAVVDVNRLGQSQPTMLQHDMDTYKKRWAAFGWRALVIDGHDFVHIVPALRKARRSAEQPTVILARTIKGQGIAGVADKDGWHGRPLKKGEEEDKALSELKAMLTGAGEPKARRVPRETTPAPHQPVSIEPPNYKIGDSVATREAYGNALLKLGAVDPAVVALDGDTKNSTYSEKFYKAYPNRFFEAFIAEQNMVGVATGLAARGKVPFVSTFACFMERACDQIRMATITQSNIKLVGSHAGVSIGEDGPSQMGLEDIAMFRAMSGCCVLYPCDATSTERAVELAANRNGMVFIRTARPKTPVIYDATEQFDFGKAKILRQSDGDKVTVVAAGVTVPEALKAHELLKADGVNIRVIDIFSVKPIDTELLVQSARVTNNTILTLEDHHIEGGVGEAVAGAVAPEAIRVIRVGINSLPRSGKPEELMAFYGLTAEKIAGKVRSLV
jgi:transketolase